MDDYIEREAFLKTWCESYCRPKQNCRDDCSFYDAITQFPVADVRENVRGEWEKGWNTEADPDFVFPTWQCSLCGSFTDEDIEREPMFKFCPYCGAEMKGENDG